MKKFIAINLFAATLFLFVITFMMLSHPSHASAEVYGPSVITLTATPTITITTTTETPDFACTRFNFEIGRDAETGSYAGHFVMEDPHHGVITTWHPPAGSTDSGWIEELEIQFEQVYVEVYFYPALSREEVKPIKMEILNPAPGTEYGWLAQGVCHAIEIQYPEWYSGEDSVPQVSATSTPVAVATPEAESLASSRETIFFAQQLWTSLSIK